MISINPFSEIGTFIPSLVMQAYVVAMFLLVIGATIFDVIHKKSAKYFFNNSVKAKKSATRNVSSGEKASLAFKTATNEVLTSSEFCSTRRRLAHLLTMYGFVLFVIATVVMIFSYSTPSSITPSLWPLMWHLGAAMLCLGGYWFWFFIRVDVAAEGNKWYRVMRAESRFICPFPNCNGNLCSNLVLSSVKPDCCLANFIFWAFYYFKYCSFWWSTLV